MTSEPKNSKRKCPDSDSGSEVRSKRRAVSQERLRIKRHSKNATVPTRGSAWAAGYDLYSAEKKVIPARGKALIDTQISVAVPEGTYGRVAPRSGLASKFGIDTGAGVIDADYRGVVYILLFNLGERDFEVSVGDRIAQLVLEQIITPDVSEVTELDDTARGSCGFGSTGGHGLLSPVSLSPVSSPPLVSASLDSPPSDPTSPDPTLYDSTSPAPTPVVLPPPTSPRPVLTSIDTTLTTSTSPDSTSTDSTLVDSASTDSTTPASTPPEPASPVSTSLDICRSPGRST